MIQAEQGVAVRAKAPRCYVVGKGSLATTCAEILHEEGFALLGIHSTDGSAAQWAKMRGVEHPASLTDFQAGLAVNQFEWLFSLNNPWVIPASVLRLPRVATVNYHDSPLPRYRGLHATTWALIHGETTHAISFHEVTESIDEGRILRQSAIDITPEDTAWTLNAKCFEAAIATFRELARELARVTALGQLAVSRQDPSQASYFGRWARPPRGGLLDFTKAAESIRDLVRALDFGPIDNPLGVPKLLVGDRLYAVGRAEVLERTSRRACGEIVQSCSESLDVATSTRVIRLSRITSLTGAAVSPIELARGVDNPSAPRLTDLSKEQADSLTSRYVELCRNEAFWRCRLRSIRQPELGYQLGVRQRPGASAVLSDLGRALARHADREPFEAVVFCLAVFAAKTNHFEPFDLGLALPEADPIFAALTAPVVPLLVDASADHSLADLWSVLHERVAQSQARGCFCKDVVLRYAELRENGEFRARVAVGVHDRVPPEESSDLFFAVNRTSREVSLYHHGALAAWQLASIDDALAQFLDCFAATPDLGLARVPWMSERCRERVLIEWNSSERSLPECSLISLIEGIALRQPHANAVRFAGYSLSYGELTRRSRGLARQLVERGVRTGDLVALSLPRGVEMIVAMLAILRAGAAYLPIDPSYPAARGRAMIERAQVSAAVTCKPLQEKFFETISPLVLCDEDPNATWAFAVPSSAEQPFPESTFDGLFCVIYTSGSTGKPKGVEITQRGMVNHALAIARNYGLRSDDRVLCSASLSFDVVGEQIYPTLVAGAEVVVRPEELFDSFRNFEDFVRNERITVMILPTSFWHEWTRELTVTGSPPPESLRALSVGTEKALGERLAQWQAVAAGRVQFFQGYGPTETTITSTMYCHADDAAESELPVGRPLSNTQVYVLDQYLQPVAPGVLGEVFISGLGVARGYRNDPALSAERFLCNPFRDEARMYRTGDLARFRADGQLVYCGRVDTQVKIRGFRVELAEIEAALAAQPEVSETLALLRTDGDEAQLVAYVVPRTPEIDVETLLAALAERLPRYMVPQSIVTLARFPKTANQKIDKRALPSPPRPASRERRVGTTASTPLQRSLVEIWTTVLGTEPSVDGDFFALGGNSLSAVRMLSKVERTHQRLVPLSVFIQNPTVIGLERELTGGEAKSSLVVTVRAGTARPPLWLVHPVGGHVTYAFRLRDHLAPHQPVMGFQAQGVDGRLDPLETVEAMASVYVRQMRELQKTGPYFIAGPSMGGLIALEMAQLLRRQGQDVALLVLIDTWGPGYPRPTSRLQKLLDQVQTVWQKPNWRERIGLVLQHGRALCGFEPRRRGKAIPPRYDALDGVAVSAELLRNVQRVWLANERANLSYEPSAYAGAVLLIRARFPMPWSGMRFDDPCNGWRALLRGPLKCETLDCSHSELVDNPPQGVALRLQAALDFAWESHTDVTLERRAS